MAAVGSDHGGIEKLTGDNWSNWKFLMKHVLLAKDLWKYVLESNVLPEDATPQQVAEYNTRSQKALTTIVVSVSSAQMYLLTSCETAKDAWKALTSHFECKTLGNKLILKKQYFRSEMIEGTAMEMHLKQMKSLAEKLAAIKSPISEEDQVVTLLGSLPETYQNVVTALEARSEDLTLSYVQQTLLYEEKKRKGPEKLSNQGDAALVSNRQPRGRGKKEIRCHLCRELGHIKRNCPSNKLQCHLCHELGHIRRNCPSEKQTSSSSQNFSSQGNFSRRKNPHGATAVQETRQEARDSDESPNDLFRAGERNDMRNDWLVDSGASSHMTRQRHLLWNYTEFQTPEKVSLGDGFCLDAEGAGNVTLKMILPDGTLKNAVLSNVLYVPGLRSNLFSVRSTVER